MLTQIHSTRGAWLILLGSVVTGAICLYYYYTPETGLIGTGGVILVAGAAVLMFLSALVMATRPARGGFLQGFLLIALLLDIIGSALAGYFLESPVILAAQGLALLGWLANVISDATARSIETDEVEDGY